MFTVLSIAFVLLELDVRPFDLECLVDRYLGVLGRGLFARWPL